MCVFASYEPAGTCISSSGPCTASATKKMAESGIALIGNVGDFDIKGVPPKGASESVLILRNGSRFAVVFTFHK